MIRRELLDRAIEHEMEVYCNEEMDFDESFLEDVDALHHREVTENPINERSQQIRHAIEEHLEKRRLQNQLQDLMEDDDDFYNIDE